jgi:hypothetical protein
MQLGAWVGKVSLVAGALLGLALAVLRRRRRA